MDFVEVWWLDHAQASLDGGGRRWRAVVHELKSWGCSPGRWATADGYIPSLGMGVYFDSFKASARWGSSSSGSCPMSSSTTVAGDEDLWQVRRDPRGFVVISFSFRVFCEVRLGQLSLYPYRMSLYLYEYMYVFVI